MDTLSTNKRKKLNKLKRLANEAFCQGEYEKAISEYTKAITIDGKSALLQAKRGECHLLLKDYNACVNDCSIALNINSALATAYKYRGRAEWFLGQRKSAVKNLRKACMLDYDEVAEGWLKEMAIDVTKDVEGERCKTAKLAKDPSKNKENVNSNCDLGNINCEGGISTIFINPQIRNAFKDKEVIAAFEGIFQNGSALLKFLMNPKIVSLMVNVGKEAYNRLNAVVFAKTLIMKIFANVRNDASVKITLDNLNRAGLINDIAKGPNHVLHRIKNPAIIREINKLAKQSIHIAAKEISIFLSSVGFVRPQGGGLDIFAQLTQAVFCTFGDSEVFNALYEMYTTPSLVNVLNNLDNPKVWSVCKNNAKLFVGIFSTSVIPLLLDCPLFCIMSFPNEGSDLNSLFQDPEFLNMLRDPTILAAVPGASRGPPNLLRYGTFFTKVMKQLIRMFVDELVSKFQNDGEVTSINDLF